MVGGLQRRCCLSPFGYPNYESPDTLTLSQMTMSKKILTITLYTMRACTNNSMRVRLSVLSLTSHDRVMEVVGRKLFFSQKNELGCFAVRGKSDTRLQCWNLCLLYPLTQTVALPSYF